MLGVGVVGAQFMGLFQDQTEKNLLQEQPAIHAKVVDEKEGVFGAYKAVSPEKVANSNEDEAAALSEVEKAAPQATLRTTAIFPAIMLACYLMIIFTRGRGGYKSCWRFKRSLNFSLQKSYIPWIWLFCVTKPP